MEEFDTIEKVEKLFKEKGVNAKEGITVALLKDYRKYSGMVQGMEHPYDGLLLNISDEGIAYFYLKSSKISLTIKMDKLSLVKDSYTFIKKEDIKSIELKKFALLDKKRKELIIKTTEKKRPYFVYGSLEDTLLPYNTEGMSKLIEKYSAK